MSMIGLWNWRGAQVMTRYSVFLIVLVCSAVIAGEPVDAELQGQAQQLAQRFVGELKPQLKQAMAEGGPTRAIEVCASMAPRIADSLSADSGWLVKRVSLKSRNASRAQPDKWEQAVLLEFDARQAAGADAATLNYSAIENGRYRYMRAQPVEPLCLVCHGENLSGPVQAVLSEYYPDDWATGYQLGQVRGAISLSRQLP
jgi:hypothetical protein